MNQRVIIRQDTNYNDVCNPFDDKAQEKFRIFNTLFFFFWTIFFFFHQLI